MSSALLNGVPEERLTQTQEIQLATRGDEDSQARLILHNLREAFIYSKGCHQTRRLADDEILSACYEGLQNAVKNFRPDQIRFFAYAKPYVRGALFKVNREKYGIVKKVRDTEPLPDPGAEFPDSVDDPYIPNLARPEVPCDLPKFDEIYLREEWSAMEPLLRAVLNDRQRMILELNFQGNLNLQEIAGLIGYSRAYVHLTKQTALKKIRNRLIEQGKYFNREALSTS